MSQMSQDSSVTLDLICNIAIGYFVQQIVLIQPCIAESIFMAVLLITLYVLVMAFYQSARSKVDQSTHLLVQTICEHFRHNRLMRQKIFNSNKSRIKFDLKFKLIYIWCLRSVLNNSYCHSLAHVFSNGKIGDFYTDLNLSIDPTCAI